MGLIFTLILFVGLAAIIVWIADWTLPDLRSKRAPSRSQLRVNAGYAYPGPNLAPIITIIGTN
jgi:hypothetical protein